MAHVRLEREVGGRTLVLETGKLGKLASGSAVLRLGESIVFVAAVDGPVLPGLDFVPLTMDYREKPSAAGKIPGGFFKREGRPTTKEILTMRCMDRPIRPLFVDGYKGDVQVQAMVLSADQENDPDILAINGASAALHVSDIPFHGPLGAVRVGFVGGKLVINPTHSERKTSLLDLVVAGTKDAVTMVEAGAKEVPEDVEGKSLAPVLRGEATKVRDSIFTAYRDVQRSVRDERWHLIRYPHINRTQLFDLQNDPHETKDLAGDPKHAERITELMGLLQRWQRELGDDVALTSAQPRDPTFVPPMEGKKRAKKQKQ